MAKDRQGLKSHADVGGGDGDSGDGGSGSASDHGFRSLWRVGSHHTSDLCPPEPAHQRALNLLPMDSADMKTGGVACSARDKKRLQRSSAGKKRQRDGDVQGNTGDDDDMGQGHGAGAQNSKEREAGPVLKKMRNKCKRVIMDNDEFTIFPRRKAGQDKLGSNRPPIVISRTVLESYFNMPQQKVCEKLGICATVIKKVCRQLGIDKWPFKGNKITLRKQGVCHGRKKGERNEATLRRHGERGCSPEGPGPRDFSEPLRCANPVHAIAIESIGMPTGLAQANEFRTMRTVERPANGPSSTSDSFQPTTHESQASRDMRFMGTDTFLPSASRTPACARLHPSMIERSLLEMERWRIGANTVGASAGGVSGAYAWESSVVLPGVECSPHHLRQQQQQQQKQRSATLSAHAASSDMSPSTPPPAGQDASGLLSGVRGSDADNKFSSSSKISSKFGFESECENKFSPGVESGCAEVEVAEALFDTDASKDTPEALEDDDQGFDLSWLVPAENSRSLTDIDVDLDRLRSNTCPFQN